MAQPDIVVEMQMRYVIRLVAGDGPEQFGAIEVAKMLHDEYKRRHRSGPRELVVDHPGSDVYRNAKAVLWSLPYRTVDLFQDLSERVDLATTRPNSVTNPDRRSPVAPPTPVWGEDRPEVTPKRGPRESAAWIVHQQITVVKAKGREPLRRIGDDEAVTVEPTPKPSAGQMLNE